MKLLTVRQVADELGMSTGFVRKEIRLGRLEARVTIARPSGRTVRKIDREDLAAYKSVYCVDRRLSA